MVPAKLATPEQGRQPLPLMLNLRWEAAHCYDITPPLQIPEDLVN